MSIRKEKSLKKEKSKILVYGITGMVGTRLKQLLGNEFKIICPPHSLLDVTQKRKVHQNIRDVMPDHIVCAAGLTKVDYAQLHRREAFLVNAEGVRHVVEKAAPLNIPVCYLSTDAVFDGTQNKRAYKENDPPNPTSIFGMSKLAGERIVLAASKRNVVIRSIMVFSFFYPHKTDLARSAWGTLKSGDQFAGIVDQFINPAYVDDLVWAIGAILGKKARGVYHAAATDYSTNYGFVEKIAKAFKFDKDLIIKTSFDDFFKNKIAPRARYCWLDTSKFRKEFGKGILHTLDESVSLFKKQLAKLQVQPIDF